MRQLILLMLLVLITASCLDKPNMSPSKPDSDKLTATETTKYVSQNYKGPVPILMYHSINQYPKNDREIPPQVFQEEMEHLKKVGYNTMSFENLKKWKMGEAIPDKPILITFDDGYLDNYTLAYPILKKLQMKATIFIVTDLIGNSNYLNWDQLKEMDQSGWIEIGAHAWHHVDLTKQTKAALENEVLGSKRILEEKLGHLTIAFAYPSGQYNNIVVETVKRAGFEFSVTTKPGYAAQEQGFLTLHRVRVSGRQSAAAFARQFP